MSLLQAVIGLADRARLHVALFLMNAGARLADVQWPEPTGPEFKDEGRAPHDEPRTTLTEEALRMIADAKSPARRREKCAQEPPLRGSARDLMDRAELARRRAGH